MRIAILDYGAGNLHSIEKAVSTFDAEVAIVADPRRALDTDVLVLPGVGAFAGAAACIAPVRDRLRESLEAGLPCLAICLGMQLLFDTSEEGAGAGIGFIPGAVERVRATVVPHMGWNTLAEVTDERVTETGLTTGYYANSFVCRPAAVDGVTAWTTSDGDRFPAIIQRQNTVGVQFHPEKSSAPGLRFIRSVLSQFARESSER